MIFKFTMATSKSLHLTVVQLWLDKVKKNEHLQKQARPQAPDGRYTTTAVKLFIAKISVSLPWKLLTSIFEIYIYRIRVSNKTFIYFLKKASRPDSTQQTTPWQLSLQLNWLTSYLFFFTSWNFCNRDQSKSTLNMHNNAHNDLAYEDANLITVSSVMCMHLLWTFLLW